jgi:RNA polymerase sigma-70 factor, ECF subfamily
MGMATDVTTVPIGIAAATVADAAAGDASALARIVGAHHDDMARICFVICGDADLAQDAVQAAWPIAWRKLRTLRDPDRLRPWLMAIAVNEARQLLRQRGRHPVVEIGVVDVGSSTTDPANRAAIADLHVALQRLPSEDRALLALRHVAGFDATEIGRVLGISPSGVRSRLARLLDRLRVELDDD